MSGVPDVFATGSAGRVRRGSGPRRAPRWAGAAYALTAVAAAAGAGAGLTALACELWRVREEIGAPAGRIGGRFRNTEPATAFDPSALGSALRGMRRRGGGGQPRQAVPVTVPEIPAVPGEMAATWLGHATVLLEFEGRRVLTDPVLGRRCSPSGRLGPRRLHRAPVDPAGLPPIDAVVISHDHYDHLERATMLGLARDHACLFVVPAGVSAHLRRWGIAPERIVELGWGGSADVAGLAFTCCEVRHFSGRGLRRDRTQWAGWSVAGARRRIFFGGDSGYTRAFADAGRAHGPFDLTILPIGAYSELWPHVHMTPEEAVRAAADLNPGRRPTLLPVHWATFDLAPHAWAEPVERLCAAVDGAGAGDDGATPAAAPALIVPEPGRRVPLGGRAPGSDGADAVTGADDNAGERTGGIGEADRWWRRAAH